MAAVDEAMAIVDQSIWCKNKQVRLWIKQRRVDQLMVFVDQAMACVDQPMACVEKHWRVWIKQ